MPRTPSQLFAPVAEAEAGQKLLRFLERRTGISRAMLHRWLRTGQIRRNGRRVKPFERISAGDEIRLPPFVPQLARGQDALGACADLPPLIGQKGDILAFAKPAGLAVHGGPGIGDSMARRLAARHAGEPFIPAPAHRLDRETSGVLLAGTTYAALRCLHAWFAANRIRKEYLAWVKGCWPHMRERIFKHYLLVENGNARAYAEPVASGRQALCVAKPLAIEADASLLHILLLTGRKRQIRAQMAACGFPVLGDARYAGGNGSPLRLHAMRAALPNGAVFACLPAWEENFAVREMPAAFPRSIAEDDLDISK